MFDQVAHLFKHDASHLAFSKAFFTMAPLKADLTANEMVSLMETLKAPLMEAPMAILMVHLLASHLAFSKAFAMAPPKADLTAFAIASLMNHHAFFMGFC